MIQKMPPPFGFFLKIFFYKSCQDFIKKAWMSFCIRKTAKKLNVIKTVRPSGVLRPWKRLQLTIHKPAQCASKRPKSKDLAPDSHVALLYGILPVFGRAS